MTIARETLCGQKKNYFDHYLRSIVVVSLSRLIVSFLCNFGLGLFHPFLGTTVEEKSRNQSLEGEA